MHHIILDKFEITHQGDQINFHINTSDLLCNIISPNVFFFFLIGVISIIESVSVKDMFFAFVSWVNSSRLLLKASTIE